MLASKKPIEEYNDGSIYHTFWSMYPYYITYPDNSIVIRAKSLKDLKVSADLELDYRQQRVIDKLKGD